MVVWQKRDSHMILYDEGNEEYFQAEIGVEKLASAFPSVSIKLQSKDALDLSYFHMGVRDSIVILGVKYKRVRRVDRRAAKL